MSNSQFYRQSSQSRANVNSQNDGKKMGLENINYENYSENQPNVRLYVTLKKNDTISEYKKLILMTHDSLKISLLKRQIEKEFSDLFCKEPTFICGKLEDEYGYSLSNQSMIKDLLKNGDRIFAIPEMVVDPKDGSMHLSQDINELLYLLKNLQQNICCKLADQNYKDFNQIEDIFLQVIPLGFSESKVIIHNVSVIMNKNLMNEKLDFIKKQQNSLVINQLISLLNFWIGDLIFSDSFLLNSTIDILEILTKSRVFCLQFKSAFVISNLMHASKLDFISTQNRSRIIRIITYLSKGDFEDIYYSTQLEQQKQQRLFNIQDFNHNSEREMSDFSQKNDSIQRVKSQQIYNGNKQIQSDQQSHNQLFSENDKRSSKKRENQQIFDDELDKFSKSQQNWPITAVEYEQDNQNQKNFQRDAQKNQYSNQNLYRDYVQLINKESEQEMLIFAVQNLNAILPQVIQELMEDSQAYLNCLNLIDTYLPFEHQQIQLNILTQLNDYLIQSRAIDGLKAKVVQRILKAFQFQPQEFQNIFLKSIQNHLRLGKYQIDVDTVISMINCQFTKIQDVGSKILSILSDPLASSINNYESQFENHVKFILEYSIKLSKTNQEITRYLIKTIANLALKDGLRSLIVYNKGVDALIYHLRNTSNIEIQRLSAQALLNLSINSRDLKLRIVTEIGDEIKMMHRNQVDHVVAGYLKTLINSNKY